MNFCRAAVAGILVAILLSAAGCSFGADQMKQPTTPNSGQADEAKSTEQDLLSALNAASAVPEQDQAIPIAVYDGVSYLLGNDLARVLNFRTHWQGAANSFQMGDFDAAYEWELGSLEVRKGDDSIRIPEPPIIRNSLIYIPVSAMYLLNEDANYDLTETQLMVHPASFLSTAAMDAPIEPGTVSELDFADDPSDPYKETEGIMAAAGRLSMPVVKRIDGEDDAVLSAVRKKDVSTIIQKARSYLGVKYLFGTYSYPQSGRFDCSAFTQYVFARNGVNLARTARAQAFQGKEVGRKSLRKGDLMFFYVPGRFRTNKTVGHVALYLGNSEVIHAAPLPKNGVQITKINNAYWKQTFLTAKRVAY